MDIKKLFTEIEKLEKILVDTFKKAPHLPKDWKNFLASAMPWFAILAVILSVLGIFSIFGILSMLSKVGFSISTISITSILGMFVLAVSAYFAAIAYKPLTEKKKLGWDRTFYAQLISILYTITTLFQGIGSFIGSIIGVFIGLYLLFEVRDEYKK